MSWDPVWEQIFASRPWGKYPPEPLVRFMATTYRDVADKSTIKVLEVGCGPGGGPAWYLAREGFSYYGIDGSAKAVDLAVKRFRMENLAGTFKVGEIMELPWEDDFFDCVIDVCCLGCNSETDSAVAVQEIYRVLKSGGRHFSLTFRSGTWGDGMGERIDATTFGEILDGPLANMGAVRFATKESLERLYEGFSGLSFGEATYRASDWPMDVRHWIVSCERPRGQFA